MLTLSAQNKLNITGMPFSSSGPKYKMQGHLPDPWLFPPVATFTESNQAKISPSLFNHSLFQTMIYHHLYLDYITFRLHMLQGRRNNVFPSPAKALASETQHFYPAVSQFEGLNMHARKPPWIPLQAAEGRLLLVHEERLFWSGDAIKWTFMWVYSSAGSL